MDFNGRMPLFSFLLLLSIRLRHRFAAKFSATHRHWQSINWLTAMSENMCAACVRKHSNVRIICEYISSLFPFSHWKRQGVGNDDDNYAHALFSLLLLSWLLSFNVFMELGRMNFAGDWFGIALLLCVCLFVSIAAMVTCSPIAIRSRTNAKQKDAENHIAMPGRCDVTPKTIIVHWQWHRQRPINRYRRPDRSADSVCRRPQQVVS